MSARGSYPSGPNKGGPTSRLSGMIPGSTQVVQSRAATKDPRSAGNKANSAGRVVPGAGKSPTRTPDR